MVGRYSVVALPDGCWHVGQPSCQCMRCAAPSPSCPPAIVDDLLHNLQLPLLRRQVQRCAPLGLGCSVGAMANGLWAQQAVQWTSAAALTSASARCYRVPHPPQTTFHMRIHTRALTGCRHAPPVPSASSSSAAQSGWPCSAASCTGVCWFWSRKSKEGRAPVWGSRPLRRISPTSRRTQATWPASDEKWRGRRWLQSGFQGLAPSCSSRSAAAAAAAREEQEQEEVGRQAGTVAGDLLAAAAVPLQTEGRVAGRARMGLHVAMHAACVLAHRGRCCRPRTAASSRCCRAGRPRRCTAR